MACHKMMDIAIARQIWRAINSTALVSLREDVVESEMRYARLRVGWLLAGAEERPRMVDEPRHVAHNAFISACDILARNMAQCGEDASWRERLGNDRKIIGDFACYLYAILGIAAR